MEEISQNPSEQDNKFDSIYGAGPVNIAGRFLTAANKYIDYPAVGFSGDDAGLTYGQLADKLHQAVTFIGPLKRREPVGLLSENRPEWGKIYLAILAGGGVVVPIDPALKVKELARVLELSGINRLFVSPRYETSANDAVGLISPEIGIVNLESIPDDIESTGEITIPDDPEYPAVKIFTSGTTGESKRVILTHGNILSDMKGFTERLSFGPGHRFLSVLPLHHTLEATCGFIAPLLSGAAIFYIRELNSREILGGIRKHQITHFISVPLLFEKIYHSILNGVRKAGTIKWRTFQGLMTMSRIIENLTGYNAGSKLFKSFRRKAGLDSVQLLVSGGAPLAPEISRNFGLMGFNFIEGYGLTETSPVLAVNEPGKVRHGSVGRPICNVEARINNPDSSGAGELVVRGPMIMAGYEENPELTGEIIRDGWFFTGDLARIDKNGYIYIVGRAKNLIVSAAGKNIYPEEIESHLLNSPYILEAIVHGKKLPNGREEVAATIYPDFDFLATELGQSTDRITDEQIGRVLNPVIKEICGHMADYKRIRHVTYLRMEMEKTSSKKIKRHRYIDG